MAKETTDLISRIFQLHECKQTIYQPHIRLIFEYCPTIFTGMTKPYAFFPECAQQFFSEYLVRFSSKIFRDRCIFTNLDLLWLQRLKFNFRFMSNLYRQNPCASSRLKPTHCIIIHNNFLLSRQNGLIILISS